MFVECTEKEMLETNGGDVIALIALCVACFAAGYMVGKDLGERERRSKSW